MPKFQVFVKIGKIPYICRMGNRVNFLWGEMFEYKFKRKPKVWTIEQIHDLWERACERGTRQRNALKEVTNKIIEEIPKTDNRQWREEYIVYFTQKDRLRYYSISYHNDWKCYGTSMHDVELKTRDEKLTFLLANKRAFELGEEYHKRYKECGSLQYRVRGILWDLVERKLQDHYKKMNTNPPEAFTIQIGSKKYYVMTDDQHKCGGYMKFHLKGEVDESDTIQIS